MKNFQQLTLDLCLKDRASFVNFFVGNNQQLVNTLLSLPLSETTPFIYIWGQLGAGKSHLLGALCQLFGEAKLTSAYLPLEDLAHLDLRILNDVETLDLLCIDDLHLVAGNLAWEEKIFYVFNNLLAQNKKLVVTANVAPQGLSLKLLDLKSRMTGGLVFALQALSDEEKVASLKLRANLRGLEMSDGVAYYLLNHYERDPESLFAALETLDQAALAAQRRLTIPFVKAILIDQR